MAPVVSYLMPLTLSGPPTWVHQRLITPAWPVGQRWVEQITARSIPGIEPSEVEHVVDLVRSKIQSLLSKEIKQEKELGKMLEVMTCGKREPFKGY